VSAPEPGQIWRASSSDRQTGHYLTLELLEVEMDEQLVPHWLCLCLDNGRTALTSLGADGESAVTWERIS
jgi:hypothetical protein